MRMMEEALTTPSKNVYFDNARNGNNIGQVSVCHFTYITTILINKFNYILPSCTTMLSSEKKR